MIQRTVLPDKKGVTLVEMMIALVILLLVFLALMQTALLSIDSNIKNLVRDEAVSIAEMRMRTLRNLSFDNIALADSNGTNNNQGTFVPDTTVQRNFRNITNFLYTSTKMIDNLNADTKQIAVQVQWQWKGENYIHRIDSVARRR